jgi:adenylate cyclase
VTEETARKLAVLLHADIVGSTSLVQLEETLAHVRFRDVFERFAKTIAQHDGTTHEIRGDALVAEFARASDAVTAALEFQAANRDYNADLDDQIRPQLRIGIAMGEVVIADNTVTGEGIVLAQRLEQLAAADGVCIQAAARDTLPKRLPFDYENLGEQELKGFEEPVKAYAVKAGSNSIIAGDSNTKTSLELPSKPSIAVLPFNNMSSESDDAFFADGISEDIITELSKFRTIFVIARNSSFAFKHESLTVKEVGQKLGVRYVVEGSVRRAGNRVRITAQLIDAVDDNHIWAERYDRNLEDIFAVQDEVTLAIVTAIEPQLTSSEQQRARRKPTENLDAWECYQHGLWHMFSYAQTNEAIDFYRRAIKLDPEFDSAYAGLAYTYAIRILTGASDDREGDLQLGVNAAETALGIDQSNPFSHFAMGRITIFSGKHNKAIAEYERAIALNPNYALAYFGLAHALWHAGRPAEALPHYEDAIRLSPHDPIMWAILASKAIALVMDEHYEEGIACSQKAQQLNDSQVFSYLAEISGMGNLGQAAEAAIAIDRARKAQPDLSMTFVEQSLPISESAGRNRFWHGLKAAGLA